MTDTLEFELTHRDQQIPLRLYAEGALFWPEGQTLFITDPHFGKADSFQRAGIAIPSAILDHDLKRLSRILHHCQAANLVVLGDFFHTRYSQSDQALATLEEWRAEHREVTMVLVQGNHDRHAGPPPAHLDVITVVAPLPLGPFVCHHLPQSKPQDEGYVLAGHLHPYVMLYDRDRSRLRLASFIFTPYQAILPAFGAFTGGSAYAPTPRDRVFAIAQGSIVEISTQPRVRP